AYSALLARYSSVTLMAADATNARNCAVQSRSARFLPYDGASTVDVSGRDPSEVVAVTDGVALEVSGAEGGIVDVLVPALSVGPVGGSDVVTAWPPVAAVMAPIAMRTPAPASGPAKRG
ncbi:MAG: hypothetical protein ACXVLX_17785, partial [Ilumatobacteraceae bacterium]